MKKVILVLSALFIGSALADSAPTSIGYVDSQIGALQNKISAVDNNTVLTTTNIAGKIGQKSIYDASGNYAAQTDALVTAEVANAAVQNAIDNEFVCVEWLDGAPHTNENCLIYTVHNQSPNRILPTGYTPLEYIESTGTQYINTGVFPSSTDCVSSKLFVTGVDTDNVYYRALFGASPDGKDYRFYVSVGHSQVWFANIRCCSADILLDKLANIEVCLTPRETGTLKITTEDNSIKESAVVRLSSGHSIKLFARNTTEFRAKMKLYSFVLKRDLNDTILNLIPARRNSDGEIGMYDTVSNQFFTNSGTGEFIAGPELNVYLPSGN